MNKTNLYMSRAEKIAKVKDLEDSLNKKREIIEKEKEEIKKLEQQYIEANKSEIPILLFVVDETLPMPDKDSDWQYEYVYYCPDLDEVRCITKHKKEELLPNTVDLRNFFEQVGIPKKKYFLFDVYRKYGNEVEYAVSILKKMIEDLFSNNEINSWNDLKMHLLSIPKYYSAPKFNEKENIQTKVLEP